jgi:hypothetical protein
VGELQVAVGDEVKFVPPGKARAIPGKVRNMDERSVTVCSHLGFFTVPHASVKEVRK